MKQFVWLNNKIVLDNHTINQFCDEGFLYAEGLFETMRTYDGEVFLLDRHIARLINSCKIMDIARPKKELLKKAVLETLKANKFDSGYVRLSVWKKSKGTGIFVFTKVVPFYLAKDYQNGFSAVILRDIRQNESSPLVKVKSLNHYFYILLGKRAKRLGSDEAIILNSKGNVCEGTRSNIFIVNQDNIFTPLVDSGCLPGITRQVVMEIAKQLGMNLKETELKQRDLLKSQEAFLTNSLIEIMPLTKIDNKLIGGGESGKKTKLILDKYRRLIKDGYE